MCGILACQRQFYKPSFKHQLPTVLCQIFPRSSKVPSLPETSSLVSSTIRFLLSQLLNRVVPNAQSFELVFRLQVSVISDQTASRHLESNQLQVKQVQQNQLFLKQLHLQDQQPQEKHQPTGRQHQQVWS